MPRKTLTQIAADTRKRTAKWREAKAAMRLPEARAVDRAALEAMFYVGRQNGPEFMIDLAGLKDITTYAVKLLTFSHHDDDPFQYDLKAVTAVDGRWLAKPSASKTITTLRRSPDASRAFAAHVLT